MRSILLLAIIYLYAPYARSAPVPKELRKPAQTFQTLTPVSSSFESWGPHIEVSDKRTPEERRISQEALKLMFEQLQAGRNAGKKR